MGKHVFVVKASKHTWHIPSALSSELCTSDENSPVGSTRNDLYGAPIGLGTELYVTIMGISRPSP